MIAFIIAFRHPESTQNYAKVVNLLDNTLRSLVNQTDQRFMAYVGCNVIPDVTISSPKVKYCCIDCPLPQSRTEVLLDKGVKRTAAIKFAESDCNPDLIFMLDGDDLVSKYCVAALNKLKVAEDSGGFWLECGYLLDVSNAKIQEKYGFNRFCGSSLAFNSSILIEQLFGKIVDPEQLTSYADYMKQCDQDIMEGLLGEHAFVRDFMISIERPLKRLITPFVCWKINTGENESRTKIPFGSKKVNQNFIEEFSISDVQPRETTIAEQLIERLRFIRSRIASFMSNHKKS